MFPLPRPPAGPPASQPVTDTTMVHIFNPNEMYFLEVIDVKFTILNFSILRCISVMSKKNCAVNSDKTHLLQEMNAENNFDIYSLSFTVIETEFNSFPFKYLLPS